MYNSHVVTSEAIANLEFTCVVHHNDQVASTGGEEFSIVGKFYAPYFTVTLAQLEDSLQRKLASFAEVVCEQ